MQGNVFSVCLFRWGEAPPDREPLLIETLSWQRPPHDRDPLLTETPTWQRPPYWHLVAATEADVMHPTRMNTCWRLFFTYLTYHMLSSIRQSFSLLLAIIANYARFISTVCTHRIRWSCEGLTSVTQWIHWIQLKHLLLRHMYNLSLPNLCATLLVGLLCSAEWTGLSDSLSDSGSRTVLCGVLYSCFCRRKRNGTFGTIQFDLPIIRTDAIHHTILFIHMSAMICTTKLIY